MSTAAGGDDPLDTLEFTPLPKQKEFITSTGEQVLLSGSFGAGKSRVGCEKGYLLNLLYPGNRGLIVRKHFSDVKASTVDQTLLEEVIPESHIPDDGHNKGEHRITHYTGHTDANGDPILSEIHYHGLDSGRNTSDDDLPRKIGSTAWGWIFVDEGSELSRGEWAQLQGRLRYKGKRQAGDFYTVPFQQIFTATNPASKQHWMYKIFFQNPEDGTHAIRMNVEDNPYVPESYVERLRKNLSGMYYERYFKGRWVGAEGMVYEEWDDEVHVIEPESLADPDQPLGEWEIHETDSWHVGDDVEKGYWVSPPEGWQVFRSIDFGYNNPFVCQWWARSPDDEMILFRELYQSNLLVADAVERIKQMTDDDWWMENTFADHDAEGNEQLRRQGIHTANAHKDVLGGIQSVKRRMQRDDRGRPRLYVMRWARCHRPDSRLVIDGDPLKTLDEIGGYVWKSDDEEVPRKKNDHGLDALRYLIYSIDGRATIDLEEMKKISDIVQEAW